MTRETHRENFPFMLGFSIVALMFEKKKNRYLRYDQLFSRNERLSDINAEVTKIFR